MPTTEIFNVNEKIQLRSSFSSRKTFKTESISLSDYLFSLPPAKIIREA